MKRLAVFAIPLLVVLMPLSGTAQVGVSVVLTVPLSKPDIITLKKDEQQIRCYILKISDTTITYRSAMPGTHKPATINRQDVLSFQLNQKRIDDDDLVEENQDEGLLGVYRMGETVPGYIISLSGDTVFGQLDIIDPVVSQYGITFTSSDGVKTNYPAGAVSEFGYNGIRYVSTHQLLSHTLHPNYTSTQGDLYLQLVLDGPSRLYRFFKIDFNKATLQSYKNPPLYMGKLSPEYLIEYPDNHANSTLNRGPRGLLRSTYEDDVQFVDEVTKAKNVRTRDIPHWVQEFNVRFAEKYRN